MVAETFIAGLNLYELLITVLVWLCVLINLVYKKGSDRIHLILVVIGYLIIISFAQNFFVSTTFMCIWFLFSGVKFFVSKEILLLLFIIILVLGFANPFFYIISYVIYTLTLMNFILGSFKQVKVKW